MEERGDRDGQAIEILGDAVLLAVELREVGARAPHHRDVDPGRGQRGAQRDDGLAIGHVRRVARLVEGGDPEHLQAAQRGDRVDQRQGMVGVEEEAHIERLPARRGPGERRAPVRAREVELDEDEIAEGRRVGRGIRRRRGPEADRRETICGLQVDPIGAAGPSQLRADSRRAGSGTVVGVSVIIPAGYSGTRARARVTLWRTSPPAGSR